jgi:hypothetical protein
MAAQLADADLALHAMHVSGWVTPERLAGWGIPEPGGMLAGLSGEGLVCAARTPRGEIFKLTGDGERRAQDWADAWLADLPPAGKHALLSLLDSFEDLDPRLKRVISQCQQNGEAAPAALSQVHEAARGTIVEIAAIGPHWMSYPGRLDHAVSQVAQGRAEYVASPLVDSYHTVWHLLHRDLRMAKAGY